MTKAPEFIKITTTFKYPETEMKTNLKLDQELDCGFGNKRGRWTKYKVISVWTNGFMLKKN